MIIYIKKTAKKYILAVFLCSIFQLFKSDRAHALPLCMPPLQGYEFCLNVERKRNGDEVWR